MNENYRIYELKIDLMEDLPKGDISTAIAYTTGDIGSSFIDIEVTKNNLPFNLEGKQVIAMIDEYTKNQFRVELSPIGNRARLRIPNDVIQVEGIHKVALKIIEGNSCIITSPYEFTCWRVFA